MKNLEDMFMEEKQDMGSITAPEELEERLREALKHKERKPERNFRRWAVAALVFILLGSYSFDAVAYYGKKMLGYDKIIGGNLGNLNELGKGQEINQSCSFSDGTEITLDGVFFDENKLVGFFKIKGYKDDLPRFELSGIRSYSPTSGSGKMEGDLLYFVQEFKAPDFYEKWMKITISIFNNNVMESKEISFTLNRNKAINQVVKQSINQSVDINGTKVSFDSISGSPLSIEVRGSIPNGPLDEKNGMGGNFVEFDLYINDIKQVESGGGMSSGLKTEFYREFDGVEGGINSIKIKDIRFVEWETVDASIPVDYTVKDMELKLGETPVIVKSLSFDGENTILKLEAPKDMEIPLGLQAGNDFMEYAGEESAEDSDKAGLLYRFKGKGDNMKLHVKEVRHFQRSSEIIDIPVGK